MSKPRPSCYFCGHPHLFGDECNAEIPAPGWSPPYYPCRCTHGTSRARLNRRSSRPPISSAIRSAVILRDGHVCQLCGCRVYRDGRAKRWPKRRLTFDHIVHYSAGGPDTVANLRVACMGCNAQRGAGELPGWPLSVLQVVEAARKNGTS